MNIIRAALENDASRPSILATVRWRAGQDSTPNDKEDFEGPDPGNQDATVANCAVDLRDLRGPVKRAPRT